MKDRKDVLVVTLNEDDEIGLVEPFMKQHKYTFPVLLAKDLVDQIGAPGIPRNWLLDTTGAMRYESAGFSPNWTGEMWINVALDTIQKIAKTE